MTAETLLTTDSNTVEQINLSPPPSFISEKSQINISDYATVVKDQLYLNRRMEFYTVF